MRRTADKYFVKDSASGYSGRVGLKCESAKMTASKMRNKLRNIFRILGFAIFALLELLELSLVN